MLSMRKPKKINMPSRKAPKTAFTHVNHKNAWLFKGTSKRITSISSPSLKACSSSVGSGSGIDQLCSFNRARVVDPLIYVPGKFAVKIEYKG